MSLHGRCRIIVDPITLTKEDSMSTSTISPEVESVKTHLKHIWMAGDYDRFSRYLESSARDFYERLNVTRGCQLQDMGGGSCQLALITANDGLGVTAVDIASNLAAALRAGRAITRDTHTMKETR